MTLADQWTLNLQELEMAITPKTKMLVGNPYHGSHYRDCLAEYLLRLSIPRMGDFYGFNQRQFVLILSRHNPLGKVFTAEELFSIGKICVAHGIVILSDEVYERLHYTDVFPRIATLDREIARYTLSVGSVGKAFNATGWRVGYVIGNKHLIKHVHNAHTLLCYTTAGPAQEAAAVGFEEAEQRGFWKSNKEDFKSNVKNFCSVLQELGLPVR